MMRIDAPTFLTRITLHELLPVVVALIFVNLILRGLLLQRLRTKHHKLWLLMGSPSNFGSKRSSSVLFHFIGRQGGFRTLHDRVLNALVYAQRFVVVAVIVLFVGIIVLALAGRK